LGILVNLRLSLIKNKLIMLLNHSATSFKSANFSAASNTSGVKLQVGFQNLNSDFILPAEFSKVKKLGKGAYGSVMHVVHKPTG
jgi:hypothetical protein